MKSESMEAASSASLLENPLLNYEDRDKVVNSVSKIKSHYDKRKSKLNGENKDHWKKEIADVASYWVMKIKYSLKKNKISVSDEQLQQLLAEQGVEPKCIELCFTQESGVEQKFQGEVEEARTKAQDALAEQKPTTAKSFLKDTYGSLRSNGQDAHIAKYV